MNHDKKRLSELSEGTRVDLGDDLLDKTRQVSTAESFEIQNTPVSSPSDYLENAKILMNEGFLEDAKRALHQVLVADPYHVVALQELEKIRAQELKQIMEGATVRQPSSKKESPTPVYEDPELLMRNLDRDLNLGLFSGSLDDRSAVSLGDLSFFENGEWISSFCEGLERDLASASAQDWIDLGIGFLEMELPEAAVRLFAGACRKIDFTGEGQSDLVLSATCLLALALISAGRPSEAISKIQPLLRDMNLGQERKIELFYLMGRTYESMKKSSTALEFYKQVIEIDGQYRDTRWRISRLRG